MMTTTTDAQHEQALALGFESVEESTAHQEWLNQQATMRDEIAAAVAKAFESDSDVIDLRFIAS